jgi:hypothetical protein
MGKVLQNVVFSRVFSRVPILVFNLLILVFSRAFLESPHFSFEPTDCETGFTSPHLLETNDLSQSVLVAISPVFGMQTADDSLVSQDDETASGDKNLDICPTLVNLIATLEQQFITIDNLLDEEDVDPFKMMRLSQW